MKKVNKKGSFKPVFIEVSKPVNQMTETELDEFAEEMLDALLGKESEIKVDDV